MQKYVLFIGIDISKSWIDVCLGRNGQKKQMPHLRVSNNKTGFAEMLRFIRQSRVYHSDKRQWLFCMEHTGVYTLPLCRFLDEQELAYTLVDPLHLKYSLGLRRGKSDAADAADIARFAFLHAAELKPSRLLSDKLLAIKSLLSLRKRLLNSKNALKVAANELQAFTKEAIHGQVVPCSEENVQQLEKSIKQVEAQALVLIRQEAELSRLYDLVTSVKGASFVTAANLLVYTAAFTAFESSRQFAVYIGLAPFERQSGSSVKAPAKVSHLAHKKLKGCISCAASSAMQHDRELRAYYKRRIAEGKNKFAVQNAIRNKFLHRIFAVVKRGTPYVEFATFNS